MQINKKQQNILDSLICERLSSSQTNLQLVDSFYNRRNGSLEITLKNEAYEEDEKNHLAYYLVKHPNGEILFYFSLKCGLLYDRLGEEENLHKLYELYCFLIEMKKDPSFSDEDGQTIDSILESIRTRKGLIKKDLERISHIKKAQILEDLEKESADNLKRVGKTFAGIEIVHFCANDACRDLWKDLNINQKLGTVVFWHFVVPILCKVRNLIGCQYLFLFAADTTPDELLVNYYKTYMGFKDSDEHGTAIPLYDYACKFLHQELNDIEKRRNLFYQEFNPDEEDF